MKLDDLKFDEDGLHYFLTSGDVGAAEGYEFVSSAYVHEDEVSSNVLNVEFRDGYLADFALESVARDLDLRLGETPGIEGVCWEDQELMSIGYEAGQEIPELLKKIDNRVSELSKYDE